MLQSAVLRTVHTPVGIAFFLVAWSPLQFGGRGPRFIGPPESSVSYYAPERDMVRAT